MVSSACESNQKNRCFQYEVKKPERLAWGKMRFNGSPYLYRRLMCKEKWDVDSGCTLSSYESREKQKEGYREPMKEGAGRLMLLYCLRYVA